MATVQLTRVVSFAAAHRYYRPEWSSEQNVEAFGKCANEHGHGHSYECHVTVSGQPAAETSMIMDLSELDAILHEEVIEPLDHHHINHAVREFAFGARVPTSEALAVYIWTRIEPRLPEGVRLTRVRVHEDRTLYAEYSGEP